jgi:hypothetical protein
MASPKNAMSIVVFAIVGICIAMAIVMLWPTHNCSSTAEGFADVLNSNGTTQCPTGTKSYTDKTGAINCCSGTINGNTCEGSVRCTFSGSLTNKYPLCGRARRRKYTGDINPFVTQIVDSQPQSIVIFTMYILPVMKDILPWLKSLVPNQLSDAGYKKYASLVDEEVAWTNDLRNDSSITSEQETKIYIQEEIMYILNRIIDIFQREPIASNKDLIQKELQSKLCKKL